MDYAQKNGVDQPATVFTSFAAQQNSTGGTIDTSDLIEFRLKNATVGMIFKARSHQTLVLRISECSNQKNGTETEM